MESKWTVVTWQDSFQQPKQLDSNNSFGKDGPKFNRLRGPNFGTNTTEKLSLIKIFSDS